MNSKPWLDAFSDLIFAGKITAREFLIDNHNWWTRLGVALIERPATKNGDSHGLKIAWTDRAKSGGRLVCLGDGMSFNPECNADVARGQRQWEDASSGNDSGQILYSLQQIMIKAYLLLIGVSRVRQVHSHGQNMVRIESRVHMRQAVKAADEQPSSDQQNQSDGGFRHHKRGAHAVLTE